MNAGAGAAGARERWAWLLFQAALFTLPWIGLGVITLITGRDLGAGMQPSWLLLLSVVILLAPELAAFWAARWRRWLPVVGPAALGLLLSVLGLWVAPAGETVAAALARYLKQVIQLLVMVSFVLVPVFYLARGRSLSALARPVVWGAVFQGCYAILQGGHFYVPTPVMAALERIFTSNPAILAGSEQLYLGNMMRNLPRLRGTACEPLYLGNYLLMVLPVVWLTGWSRVRQALLGAGLTLLLLLTWSRGAWLAGLLTLLGLLGGASVWQAALPWRPLRRAMWGFLAFIGLVAVAGALSGRAEIWLPWQRLQQSFSTVDWSNLTRLYSMQAAWRAFLLSPLVGIGWGQFGFHFAALVDPMGLQSMFNWPVVNNFPLAILCETGVVGLAGSSWLVWRLVRALREQLQLAPPSRRLAWLLLASGVGGVWLQLLTFSQYNLPHIWVGIGLLVGVLLRPAAATEEGRR